jgi:hypothetical protein
VESEPYRYRVAREVGVLGCLAFCLHISLL